MQQIPMEKIKTADIDPAKLRDARLAWENAAPGRNRAVAAEVAGVGWQQIWQIENGTRKASQPVLVRLCLLYGISVAELLPENFLLAA